MARCSLVFRSYFARISLVFRLYSACIPLVFRLYSSVISVIRRYDPQPCFGTYAWLLRHPRVDGFARVVLLPGSSAARNQVECGGHAHPLL